MLARKLSCAVLTACRHLPPIFRRQVHNKVVQSHCSGSLQKGRSSVVATGQAPPRTRSPLAELPVTASVSTETLFHWYVQHQTDLQSVGHNLSQTFDGPTAEDLQAELDWLLDDCVADFEGSQHGPSSNTKWRQLKRQKRQMKDELAHLRLDLDDLAAKWRSRVLDRVPLQYLTGSAHWRDLVLAVGPGVLIPRPETELLVDFVQEAMAVVPGGRDGIWADLGTGSGALSIAVARCLSNKGRVYAIDASEEAAAWARFNVQRYSLEARLQVLLGSWFEPLQAFQGQLSGVLCNPPYIASELVPTLQAEVTRHEPWSALDGGKGSGSAMLLDICTSAVGMLRPGGFIAFETGGDAQAHEVAAFMSGLSDGGTGTGTAAYVDVNFHKDLRGVARFVTAYRASV